MKAKGKPNPFAKAKAPPFGKGGAKGKKPNPFAKAKAPPFGAKGAKPNPFAKGKPFAKGGKVRRYDTGGSIFKSDDEDTGSTRNQDVFSGAAMAPIPNPPERKKAAAKKPAAKQADDKNKPWIGPIRLKDDGAESIKKFPDRPSPLGPKLPIRLGDEPKTAPVSKKEAAAKAKGPMIAAPRYDSTPKTAPVSKKEAAAKAKGPMIAAPRYDSTPKSAPVSKKEAAAKAKGPMIGPIRLKGEGMRSGGQVKRRRYV